MPAEAPRMSCQSRLLGYRVRTTGVGRFSGSAMDVGLVRRDDVEPKNKESRNRPRWNKGLLFFLSCLSISIGLGNVWRFPTLAYQNGGGAFLIPYFILLFVVGKPVYFLELAIGQFSGKGGVKTWECVPGFKGISVAQFVTSFYILVAYNYIMALCLFYLFASMQSPLPWSNCDPQWSDENCFHQSMASIHF
ncbi:hypothetical protein HPB51_015967 [Rhipicephalus microplus]|uniref:Sodium-dependent nutrient amino acid transporter 1 n=1 Tax=Rhipicephalus microplus TaxID=6941 RepID=A0A9J6DHY5_RHIMP|nr:hypothetical protein HPB51_015967 [Rhipicephalus microplus]